MYGNGLVDVLITSNSAAATVRLGRALARCALPPLLVVMHTIPGSVGAARAHLRKIEPHITQRFDVPYQQMWSEIDEPPGRCIPKQFTAIIRSIPDAVRKMYSSPQSQSVAYAAPERQEACSVAAASMRPGRTKVGPSGESDPRKLRFR